MGGAATEMGCGASSDQASAPGELESEPEPAVDDAEPSSSAVKYSDEPPVKKCLGHPSNQPGYKKPGAQPVAANVPTGPSNAVQWTPQLGQEFKKHYDSGFEEEGSKKCVKTVFSLFSNGNKTLAQPQLYRLLEVCGMPPKDFSAATSFMEFDRNKTSKIEQSELTKGLSRRSKQKMVMKCSGFGIRGHIPVDHSPDKEKFQAVSMDEKESKKNDQRTAVQTDKKGKAKHGGRFSSILRLSSLSY